MLLLASAGPGSASSFPYELLGRVLETHVDGRGRVDYAGLKVEPSTLNAFVDSLAEVSPVSTPGRFPTREDSLAYWINAYNALVLRGVLDAYPVDSVRDIKLFYGFFKRTDFVVGGRDMTLDDIEHGIIRERFEEPRIHAAINCAAISCPRLRREPFRPETLDRQLETAMREFVQDPRHVRIDRDRNTIHVSAIFDWFEEDFTSAVERRTGVDEARITDYLLDYVTEADRRYLETHPDVRVKVLDYDWGLNKQR